MTTTIFVPPKCIDEMIGPQHGPAAQLRAAFQRSSNTASSVIVLGGPRGSGKTTLLNLVAQEKGGVKLDAYHEGILLHKVPKYQDLRQLFQFHSGNNEKKGVVAAATYIHDPDLVIANDPNRTKMRKIIQQHRDLKRMLVIEVTEKGNRSQEKTWRNLTPADSGFCYIRMKVPSVEGLTSYLFEKSREGPFRKEDIRFLVRENKGDIRGTLLSMQYRSSVKEQRPTPTTTIRPPPTALPPTKSSSLLSAMDNLAQKKDAVSLHDTFIHGNEWTLAGYSPFFLSGASTKK